MTGTRISDMTTLTGFASGTYAPVERAGVNYKVDLSDRIPYTPEGDYGAAGTGLVDDSTALNAFWADVIANNLSHDCSGTYGLASGLIIGPSAAPSPASAHSLVGRMKLTALAPMNEMVRLRNLSYRRWHGGLWNVGIGSSSFASRTCLISTYIENCARLEITDGLYGSAFALANAYFGTANNNLMKIGGVFGSNIGSGMVGNSLTATWSTPVNSGTTNSTSQRTTINVTSLPSTAIEAYEQFGTSPIQVRIAGYLYFVYSIDRALGTATIYPWLDNASVTAGTGTLEWVLGGNHCTRSSDSNLIQIERIEGNNVGRNISEGVLYGSIITDMMTNGAGTEICLGSYPSQGCMGTLVSGRYIESGVIAEQIVALHGFGASNFHSVLGGSGAIDLSKCWAVGNPRVTAGTIQGGEFGATTSGAGALMMANKGRLLQHLKSNLNNLPGSSINLRGQSRPPHIEVYRKDTVTFLLNVEGSGEYNRLFGYSGGSTLVVGTGTNGAPTSVVFTPPSGGTINGGSVDATVTFNTFNGPAHFSYEHTDTAQLTWLVRMMSGRQLDVSSGDVTGVLAAGRFPALTGDVTTSAGALATTLSSATVVSKVAGQALAPLSVAIGSGTVLTKAVVYTPTLTPASVAAAVVAEQTFTVTGLTTADKVIVNPPAIANATGIAGARVSAADTLAIRFVNPTAGALTPTSGTYTVLAFRS